MTKTIYTLHHPDSSKEYLQWCVDRERLIGTDDFQWAIQLHGVEQLEGFIEENPDTINLLVKEHELKTSDLNKGTVKELLAMSNIAPSWEDADICRNG